MRHPSLFCVFLSLGLVSTRKHGTQAMWPVGYISIGYGQAVLLM